jgi:hypothetical protein
MDKLQRSGSVLVGLVLTAALAACGGGGGDPISSAISGGDSGAAAATTGTASTGATTTGVSTGTVTAPATGTGSTTQTTTTSGYTKATLSGVYSRCPLKTASQNSDWWTCVTGLEFVGLTTFGGKACSLRVRNDGAFEYTSNGITYVTPNKVDNVFRQAGSYGHAVITSPERHIFRADQYFSDASGRNYGDVSIELTNAPTSYEVIFSGESCKLNIQ